MKKGKFKLLGIILLVVIIFWSIVCYGANKITDNNSMKNEAKNEVKINKSNDDVKFNIEELRKDGYSSGDILKAYQLSQLTNRHIKEILRVKGKMNAQEGMSKDSSPFNINNSEKLKGKTKEEMKEYFKKPASLNSSNSNVKSWDDVAVKLGVNPEYLNAKKDEKNNKKIFLPKKSVELNEEQKKVCSDIGMDKMDVQKLVQISSKFEIPIDDVISFKKKYNDWNKVVTRISTKLGKAKIEEIEKKKLKDEYGIDEEYIKKYTQKGIPLRVIINACTETKIKKITLDESIDIKIKEMDKSKTLDNSAKPNKDAEGGK